MSTAFIDKLVENNKHLIEGATIYGEDISKLSALQSQVLLAMAHWELQKRNTNTLNYLGVSNG